MDIQVPDARMLSDEVLDALRLRALRGCQLGFTEAQLSFILGVSRETISRWWCAFADHGPDGLPGPRSGRPLGSGRLLDDQQARHIRHLLDNHSPEELGIASPLWSRRAVGDLIFKEFGIRLAVRSVGEYLKRWGYTPKKPRRHARKQDPEEVRQWLEKTYPDIEEQAEKQNATIFWCDETGAAADEHPARGYSRRGQPATMQVPEAHIRMNQISAISKTGKVRFMTYKGALNGALFLVFLGRLLRSTTAKVLLIADRLRAHQSAEVQEWLNRHKERIEVFYMPRRAPELNADEYLNNDLKGRVNAQGLPNSKEDLRTRILAFMRRLLHLPAHVMSYFQHPCVLYAS